MSQIKLKHAVDTVSSLLLYVLKWFHLCAAHVRPLLPSSGCKLKIVLKDIRQRDSMRMWGRCFVLPLCLMCLIIVKYCQYDMLDASQVSLCQYLYTLMCDRFCNTGLNRRESESYTGCSLHIPNDIRETERHDWLSQTNIQCMSWPVIKIWSSLTRQNYATICLRVCGVCSHCSLFVGLGLLVGISLPPSDKIPACLWFSGLKWHQ